MTILSQSATEVIARGNSVINSRLTKQCTKLATATFLTSSHCEYSKTTFLTLLRQHKSTMAIENEVSSSVSQGLNN